MGQEPIDFFGVDAVFVGDLGEGFFHCIADDVFIQQFDVLFYRHQAVAAAVIGIGVFPAFKYAVAEFCTGIHAGRHFVGVGKQVYPMDFQAEAV